MDTDGLLSQPSRLRQATNRSRLLEITRSKAILVELIADRDGYLDTRAVDWETYWQPHAAGLNEVGRQKLATLGQARDTYIASGFDPSEAVVDCQSYFDLLQSALRSTIGQTGPLFLQALVGLEVFEIRGFWDETLLAAGAINLRHPVYLLGKLRWPRAQADPKFLPLVCLPPDARRTRKPIQLFYHYRQISLDANTGTASLVFPAVPMDGRAASFGPIEWLTTALRSKPDPWSRRRAQQIADCAVGPFLAHHKMRPDDDTRGEIAFADIGGGSGVLVGHLCQNLLQRWAHAVADRSFAWTFVDLSVRNPARHTGSPRLRRAMSFAEYVAADYRSWALQEARKTTTPKWHIALISRLLNNLSTFSIEWTLDLHEQRLLAGGRTGLPTSSRPIWHPVNCLCANATQPSQLLISTGQVAIRDGRSLRQLSLTDYFEALHRLTQSDEPPAGRDSTVFFPIRRFNPDALRLEDGSSLFERLCAIANLVVVEDVDLTPHFLVQHLEHHRLVGLAASDATDERYMHSAHLFCVTRREQAPCLPGRRLW